MSDPVEKKVDKNSNTIVCQKVEDLHVVAEKIFERFNNKKIFAFYGELGAGKTTLIKFLCDELGVIDTVNSPTFAIINIYQSKSSGDIYHFDFYRLKSETEAFDIGYEDYFYNDSYCFIEWPEKIPNLLPEETVKIHIEVDNSNNYRIIHF